FVGLDPDHDLALVKVKGITGKPLVIDDSSNVSLGTEIFAIGNPVAPEAAFSHGVVTDIRHLPGGDLLEITARIANGVSGGPVVDRQGRVVGVVAGTVADGRSLNFAIPAVHIRTLLRAQTPLVSFREAMQGPGAGSGAGGAQPATAGSPQPSLGTEDAVDRRD